jgi:hypothetical protein
VKIHSAPFGLILIAVLLAPGVPVLAQTAAPAAEVVWSATNDFAGKMMDIDRFDNVYSVGDNAAGIVLTRKFNPDGLLLWERIYQPENAVSVNWVAADPNGGAYVAGNKWTGSNKSPIGYFVLRYDADGNLRWSDVPDGTGMAVRAVADRAGNAYVTGHLPVGASVTTGIVKYTPAGRQWVCPVVSPNGGLFPGTPAPTGLYLSDDEGSVAASGSSGYNYYVLSCDQAGFKRFQDFRDQSVYAAGVAINDQGELFFGNGLAGGAGMQITKYSTTGVVLWTNLYPHGDYIHRLALDTQGNVIATGPDYSGSYANWITIKVSPAGALLWSATYDALIANNEIPAFVALDALDNVYVTGVGGPEVVAANGSRYMRMVTLKYSAGGALVWTIGAIDGGSGNAVRVGSDGSTLFVQGYGGMYTARYRQTDLGSVPPPAPAPPPNVTPPAPTNLSATALSQRRIQLRWTNNSSAQAAVSLERCASPCTSFVEVARLDGSATSVIDRGLASRTSYSYRIRAYDGTAWSPYSASVTVTTLR